MRLIFVDRLGSSPPGFKPVVPLNVGEHTRLVRVGCQERVEHCPKLSAHLGEGAGHIDHRDVVPTLQLLESDRVHLISTQSKSGSISDVLPAR